MVDAAQATMPKFTTINYTDKNGKALAATKQGNTVTIVNTKDPKDVKQMELQDFLQNELPKMKNISLEKVPAKDTVEIGKKATDAAPADAPKPKNNATGDKKLDVAA